MDGREVTSVYKLFNDNTISKIYIFFRKKIEIQNLSEKNLDITLISIDIFSSKQLLLHYPIGDHGLFVQICHKY